MVVTLIDKLILEFQWCCFQVDVVAIIILDAALAILTLRAAQLELLHIKEVVVHLTFLNFHH